MLENTQQHERCFNLLANTTGFLWKPGGQLSLWLLYFENQLSHFRTKPCWTLFRAVLQLQGSRKRTAGNLALLGVRSPTYIHVRGFAAALIKQGEVPEGTRHHVGVANFTQYIHSHADAVSQWNCTDGKMNCQLWGFVLYFWLMVGMTLDAPWPLPVQVFPWPLHCLGASSTPCYLDKRNGLSDLPASVWSQHHLWNAHPIPRVLRVASWTSARSLPCSEHLLASFHTPVEIKAPSSQSSPSPALHQLNLILYHPATLTIPLSSVQWPRPIVGFRVSSTCSSPTWLSLSHGTNTSWVPVMCQVF